MWKLQLRNNNCKIALWNFTGIFNNITYNHTVLVQNKVPPFFRLAFGEGRGFPYSLNTRIIIIIIIIFHTIQSTLSSYHSTAWVFQRTESVIRNRSTTYSFHIVFCNFLACPSKVLAPAQGTFAQLSTDRVGPTGEPTHISRQANYPASFIGNRSFSSSVYEVISVYKEILLSALWVYGYDNVLP